MVNGARPRDQLGEPGVGLGEVAAGDLGVVGQPGTAMVMPMDERYLRSAAVGREQHGGRDDEGGARRAATAVGRSPKSGMASR